MRRLRLAVKWILVALGAYILIGLGIQSLRRGEVGIGVAFLVYLVHAGVTRASDGWRWISARRRL